MTRHAPAALIAAAILPLAAACGGSAAPQQPPATQLQLTNTSKTLVLPLGDLGSGFVNLPAQSKSVPLSEELQHESAAAQAADRRSYVGGYDAMYGGNGSVVLSVAAEYRSSADAQIVFGDALARAYFDRSFHTHAVAAPAGSPGDQGSLRVGRATIKGRVMQVRAYVWRHGRVGGAIVLLGPFATTANLMSLASTQDQIFADQATG
jgi:hypothetical protein